MHSVVRKISVLTAVVVALVSFGTALAVSPAITFVSPSPSDGATLTTSSVSFAFTYNRTPRQTSVLVCTLSGPTSSSGACDTPVATGTGSKSGKSYSGLANGAYTFTVSLTLTDGGTTTATRQFTINTSVPLRHVYWTNVDGRIGRANVDGTSPNQSFITGAFLPDGVAVDGSYAYWTNNGNGRVGRANLDGTSPNQSFITGAIFPRGVAVNGSYVYWANLDGRIGRANLEGTSPNQNFIIGASFPVGVAVDGG
jgi:virginiamycin B lyase